MNDFFRILFASELKALSGRSYRAILALVAILFFTILALGVAYGTLDRLKERMDNPYTNWVDVPVTVSIEPRVDELLRYFKDPNHLAGYDLLEVTNYDVYYANFIAANKIDTVYLRGRSVEPEERILADVLANLKGNVLVQRGALLDNPCGVIVTRKFLRALGYVEDWSSVLKIEMPYGSNVVLLDILAVVEELPNLCDFFSSAVLPNMRNLSTYETGFISEDLTNNVQVLASRELSDAQLEGIRRDFQALNLIRAEFVEPIESIKGKPAALYSFLFPVDGPPTEDDMNRLFRRMDGDFSLQLFKETKCNTRFAVVDNPDHLAFQFKSLDRIRAFKEGMLSQFGINVSMQQIESAENFSMVSGLTWAISLVLFGFALLSMGFYISSLIRSHLSSMAPNLGTIKAFGLPNAVLTKVYVGIVAIFCVGSALFALLLAWIVQLGVASDSWRFGMNVFNDNVLLALLLIVLICLWIAFGSARKILANTPGNLIYRRI